jgi:hypothetical protein
MMITHHQKYAAGKKHPIFKRCGFLQVVVRQNRIYSKHWTSLPVPVNVGTMTQALLPFICTRFRL